MDTHDEAENPDREWADEGLRILAAIIARWHRHDSRGDAPSQEAEPGITGEGAQHHGEADNDDKAGSPTRVDP